MQRAPTILIVEDDPLDRELVERAFRVAAPDAFIHAAPNGEVAISYLKGTDGYADRTQFPYPNLIVTDLKMPIADGFAVLEFLKSHPQLAVIPTVVLSGSADQNDVSTAYRLGASSYIAKPSSTAEMHVRLNALIVYWTYCEAPAIAASGRHLKTDSRGKLGERYDKKSG
jgi:CheY-like chemotaxis protein